MGHFLPCSTPTRASLLLVFSGACLLGGCETGEDATTSAPQNLTREGACTPTGPAPAPVLAGTSPMNPSFVDHANRAISFHCFGACGARCELMAKTERTIRVCEASPCEPNAHRILTYAEIAGATHPFCSWHDACYLECSKSFALDDDAAFVECSRWCDFGCTSPERFNESQESGVFDRTRPVEKVASVVLEATGDSAARRRSILATRGAGAVPLPRTWNDEDCAGWALTGFVGSNGVTDEVAASEGRARFTRLVSFGLWQPGSCEEATRADPGLERASAGGSGPR